ncbi:MAG: hypothetical protein J6T81_00760 [Bacteroidales bacterium]|nr:hypothetical protein [Bacteroidales bacterium]
MVKKSKIVAVVATLLIAAAGVITFEACNKKNDVVKNIPELNVAELTDMDKEMILFGEKMKSATKGGETMPLEEAIRNLSNYENFKMCDASNYSADMERLTIESVIPVNNGNVFLSDLNSLYENNKREIIKQLNNIDNIGKDIYCIISKIDENNKDDQEKKIITKVLLSRGTPIHIPTCFDSTDIWHPCCGAGKCYPYNSNQFIGRSAITQLISVAKSVFGHYDCGAGYRTYYVDPIEDYIMSTEWIDTNSPNGHYGLIHMDYESNCLSPIDMQYYLSNIMTKLIEWRDTYDKQFVDMEIWEIYLPEVLLLGSYADIECTYIGQDY